MIKARKLSLALFIATFLLAIMLMAIMPSTVIAQAEENTIKNFDNTDILDDLSEMTDLEGTSFSFDVFKEDSKGTAQLFNFVEYGFADTDENSKMFGLYLYIYNPTAKALSTDSNKVTVATSFQASKNNNGFKYVESYSIFSLKYVSKTINNLFYKFKVDDSQSLLYNLSKGNKVSRQYSFGELTLKYKDLVNVKIVSLGHQFMYSGYSKGLSSGTQEKSTLSTMSESLETLSLDLKHTFFRYGEPSSAGDYTSQQTLHTVYFSVPNEVIEAYGNMQKIHAEWEEYKTLPVYVISEEDVYEELLPYVGQELQGDELTPYDYISAYGPVYLFDKALQVKMSCPGTPFFSYNATNMGPGLEEAEEIYFEGSIGEHNSFLAYLFYTGDLTEDGSNPYASDIILDGEELLEYIVNYSQNNSRAIEVLPPEGTPITIIYNGEEVVIDSNLFLDYVDDDRTFGRNEWNISADEEKCLVAYKDVSTAWQAFWGNRQYEELKADGIKSIFAMESQAIDDLNNNSKRQFCNKYFIDESDYVEFKDVVEQATANNETVYLFRFAITNYEAVYPSVYAPNSEAAYKTMDTENGRVTHADHLYYKTCSASSSTVFLNFDIIDVTFQKDNKTTVLSVVSSPINIVSDSTPPLQESTWQEIFKRDFSAWLDSLKADAKKIGMIIGGVVLLIIIISVIGWIVKARRSSNINKLVKENKKKKRKR